MTSVGRFQRAMTLAMVKVLPLPVTPSSVWERWPCWRPSISLSTAWGWSPVGAKSETRRKSGIYPLRRRLNVLQLHQWRISPESQMPGGIEHLDAKYLLVGAKVHSNVLSQANCGDLCLPLPEVDVGRIHAGVIPDLHSEPPRPYSAPM